MVQEMWPLPLLCPQLLTVRQLDNSSFSLLLPVFSFLTNEGFCLVDFYCFDSSGEELFSGGSKSKSGDRIWLIFIQEILILIKSRIVCANLARFF